MSVLGRLGVEISGGVRDTGEKRIKLGEWEET